MRHFCSEKAVFFKYFGLNLDLDFTFENIFGLCLDLDWGLKKQDWVKIEKYDSPLISGQRWAWTASGLDILQDTCDFFGLGLDLDIDFWKNWIRTGSGYLFDFHYEISLRVLQEWRYQKWSWYQRWSDSRFLLSDPILFLKNDICIQSEFCFGLNHTICIRYLSESVL